MKRIHVLFFAALASAAIAVPLTATSAAQPSAHASRAAKIQLRRTSLGKILVDTSGFTVFRFSKDTGKKNTCVASRECSRTWPALTSSGKPTAGPGVNASLLSTIRLPNGSTQVTYAGHPLYRYALASERAETSYVGVQQFGGKWYAVSATGSNVK
jgi:predicted lipoprotein with Yx(FWY)xxD motif